jgi:hypothetical protein
MWHAVKLDDPFFFFQKEFASKEKRPTSYPRGLILTH